MVERSTLQIQAPIVQMPTTDSTPTEHYHTSLHVPHRPSTSRSTKYIYTRFPKRLSYNQINWSIKIKITFYVTLPTCYNIYGMDFYCVQYRTDLAIWEILLSALAFPPSGNVTTFGKFYP